MKNLKTLTNLSLSMAIVLTAAVNSFAKGEEISFTLNGKKVTSVPIDLLPKVQVTVNSGDKTFKQFYVNQWGDMSHSLNLYSMGIDKSKTPNFDNSKEWYFKEIASSFEDNNWYNTKNISYNMRKAASRLELYRFNTLQNLAFASYYVRQSKTGKTIWQNNGWVEETVWTPMGQPVAKGILKLDPPTPENRVADWSQISNSLVDYVNNHKPYDNTAAEFFAKYVYNNDDNAKYEGSTINNLEKLSEPYYTWNYLSDTEEVVYAEYKVKFDLNAIKTGKGLNASSGDAVANIFNAVAKASGATKTEEKYNCSDIVMKAEKKIGSDGWKGADAGVNADTKDHCKKM